MAIVLVYSTSGITSGKKVCRELKIVAILKIGQILKFIYLRQYLSYSVDQILKMSEMPMAIFMVYSTSGITSGKKVCRAQNDGHFKNFEILNTASIWPQIWKDRPKLCQKKFFYGDDVIDDVTGWPQIFSLYSCLGEVGSGSKLQGQCLVNKCQYHNCLTRLYMPKDDLNELHFSRLQVKGQHNMLTGWPWH